MVPRVHSPIHFKDANYQSAQFIGLQAHGSMHIICSICDERSPSTAIAHSLCQFATMMLASLFRSGRHRLRNLQGLLLSQRSDVHTLIHDLLRPRPCRGVSRSTPCKDHDGHHGRQWRRRHARQHAPLPSPRFDLSREWVMGRSAGSGPSRVVR